MGFYLRDSIKIGPLRFNLSKGGIGVSVGVRGLRIGTGTRGPYLHAGRDGLYYRTSLGRGGAEPGPSSDTAATMMPVATAPAAAIGSEPAELVRSLNEGRARHRWRGATIILAILLAGVTSLWVGAGGLALLVTIPPLWIAMGRIDRRRRSTNWTYAADVAETEAYRALRSSFDDLSRCQGRWRIPAGSAVEGLTGWKRHAGAHHLLERIPIRLSTGLPTLMDCNIVPPAIVMPGLRLFLLPDLLLIDDRTGFAGIPYVDLKAQWETSRFIERKAVPSDTEILEQTWAHPNKDGGPDQRFRDNRQIPVCGYATLRIRNGQGFDLLLIFSHPDSVAAFAGAFETMAGRPPERMFDRMIDEAVRAIPKALPKG